MRTEISTRPEQCSGLGTYTTLDVSACDHQILPKVSDRCAAILCHDDGILDAHPEVIGNIDSGLHGHNTPGDKRCVGVRRETRVLMELESNTMAKSKTVFCQLATEGCICQMPGRLDKFQLDSIFKYLHVFDQPLRRDEGRKRRSRLNRLQLCNRGYVRAQTRASVHGVLQEATLPYQPTGWSIQ